MPRVLAIDDEPIFHKMIEHALSPLGYEVYFATDGFQGLNAVNALDPDMVITDVMMPNITGYELTRRLRENPRFADMPILILTSRDQLGDKLKAFESGADDYLSKPFAPPELVARVGVLLSRGEKLRTLRSMSREKPVESAIIIAVHSLRGGVGCSSMAVNLGVALRELRTVIVAGVLAYWLVRLTPAGRDGRFDPWPLVWGLGIGAAVVAGWGIAQAVGGVGLIGAEGVWRVRGPYGSPNNLALYLGHVLPILLALTLFGESRWRRLGAGLLATLIFLSLVLTFSKGALLLGLPAGLLALGFMAGGRWRWVALGLLAVGGLALLPLFGTERFAGLFDLQGGTSFFRLQLWRGAWNMVQEHPWLGVGLDNFLYAYRTRYALPTAWQELNLSHPHTIVLDFWTRLGLLGLAVGVWLFTAAIWQNWQALKRAEGDRWALLLGLLASLAATLAHGLIDNSVFLVDLMLLFMLSIGLIARLGQELMGTERN